MEEKEKREGGIRAAEGAAWLAAANRQKQLRQLQEINRRTACLGLMLSEQELEILMTELQQALQREQRIEFGESIMPAIIYAFCDSDYIDQGNYLETLIRLQEIFFMYKGEMADEITDDELLNFMREQFDGVCGGDLDYLEGTCLEIFAEAIRAGYRSYCRTEGKGEFRKMDIVTRWDRSVFEEVLKGLEA